MSDRTDIQITDPDLTCGLGKWRPAWLQRFATAKTYVLVFGLIGTVHATGYIYYNATVSTMEKRFKISSKMSGYIIAGREIGVVLFAIFITYYGGYGDRPTWIAFGIGICGFAALLLSLPHLIYGAGEEAIALARGFVDETLLSSTTGTNPQDSATALCSATLATNTTAADTDNLIVPESIFPLIVLFSANLVFGVGTTLYYGIGTTYLDDCSKKKNSPLMIAIATCLRFIGPTFGFMMAAACLSIYVDPSLDPVIDNSDPRWIGAWWLGWFILGVSEILISFLLAMFPRKLPLVAAKEAMLLKQSNVVPQLHQQPKLKDLPRKLAKLFKNKILMANISSTVFMIVGLGGEIYYITKYIEIVYIRSAADASLLPGPARLLFMAFGLLFSGIILTKFQPRARLITGWNVVIGFLYVLTQLSFILLGCPDSELQGTPTEDGTIDLSFPCNTGCGCDGLSYNPVCSKEYNVTYYSPCHAGCLSAINLNESVIFTNCSCITGFGNVTGEVESGPCQIECQTNFILFLVFRSVLGFVSQTGRIGNMIINFRCVDPEDKTLSQGITMVFNALFGFIPGSIIFGAIFDFNCLIWDDKDGQKGNCWVYDRHSLIYSFNITISVFILVATLFDILVCIWSNEFEMYPEVEGVKLEKMTQGRESEDLSD